MDDVREKLKQCFAVTFPDMDSAAFTTADVNNTKGWDSVAQVTLLTVIGQEFDIDVDFEEFEDATSFERLAQRLQQVCDRA